MGVVLLVRRMRSRYWWGWGKGVQTGNAKSLGQGGVEMGWGVEGPAPWRGA